MAIKVGTGGVEEALDSIDYDWNKFKPTMDALKFTTFIQEVNNGEGEEDRTPIVHTAMMEKVFNKKKKSLVLCHRGLGKLNSSLTEIITPTGKVTMKDIKVGDKVVSRYGKEATVDYKTEAQMPEMYLMTLSDGSTMEVGDEHNHIVWMYRKRGREKVLTTKQLLERPLYVEAKDRKNSAAPKGSYTYSIPLVEPIEYSYKTLPIEPYVMGLMLSDGYFKGGSISCHLDDMLETGRLVAACGYNINRMEPTSPNGGKLYLPRGEFKEYYDWTFNRKKVPSEYLIASIQQRQALLQGLMDGDGSLSKNGTSTYHSVNKQLAEGVRDLVRSLGGISYLREYVRDDKDTYDIEYQVVVNIKINPFRMYRKATRWKATKKTSKAIVSLEPLGKREGYCIHLDSDDHSYLDSNYTVTHNTTVFAEYLFMHIAAFGYMPGFGNVDLALYISDSVENGVKNLRRNIEHRYGNSEMMQKMIPNRKVFVGEGTYDSDGRLQATGNASRDVTSDEDFKAFQGDIGAGKKFTDIRLEFKNHKGHTFVVKGYGAAQGVRGSKELGVRPQLAIFDDILSDTDATSPTIINTIENTVYKAVSKALDPKRQKQIWLGTPFNQNDPIYKAAESGVWELACYPVAQDFDATTTRETFKGSWGERFGFDYVKEEFDSAMALGRPSDFYQELMLRISNSDDRLIQENDIVTFNRDEMIHKKDHLNFYITTDAATTDSASADYSVIMVWGVNSNGDILLMDWWFGKVLLSAFIDNLFRLTRIWKQNLLGVGVEVSGQQGGTLSTMKDKMIRENNFFFLLSHGNKSKEGIRPAPGTRKYERFQAVQPKFSNKKIWFPDNMNDDPFIVEMMNEIRYVGRTNTGKKIGKAKNDDILDCIAMLSMIDLIPPSKDLLDFDRTLTQEKPKGGFFKGSQRESSEPSGWDSYL